MIFLYITDLVFLLSYNIKNKIIGKNMTDCVVNFKMNFFKKNTEKRIMFRKVCLPCLD